jgi:hypothetical protein
VQRDSAGRSGGIQPESLAVFPLELAAVLRPEQVAVFTGIRTRVAQLSIAMMGYQGKWWAVQGSSHAGERVTKDGHPGLSGAAGCGAGKRTGGSNPGHSDQVHIPVDFRH